MKLRWQVERGGAMRGGGAGLGVAKGEVGAAVQARFHQRLAEQGEILDPGVAVAEMAVEIGRRDRDVAQGERVVVAGVREAVAEGVDGGEGGHRVGGVGRVADEAEGIGEADRRGVDLGHAHSSAERTARLEQKMPRPRMTNVCASRACVNGIRHNSMIVLLEVFGALRTFKAILTIDPSYLLYHPPSYRTEASVAMKAKANRKRELHVRWDITARRWLKRNGMPNGTALVPGAS